MTINTKCIKTCMNVEESVCSLGTCSSQNHPKLTTLLKPTAVCLCTSTGVWCLFCLSGRHHSVFLEIHKWRIDIYGSMFSIVAILIQFEVSLPLPLTGNRFTMALWNHHPLPTVSIKTQMWIVRQAYVQLVVMSQERLCLWLIRLLMLHVWV